MGFKESIQDELLHFEGLFLQDLEQDLLEAELEIFTGPQVSLSNQHTVLEPGILNQLLYNEEDLL